MTPKVTARFCAKGCAKYSRLGVIRDCAAWDRLVAKYGDRGYRYALLEAGHMAQNILLTCTALRRAAVPIGGFLDDACASAIGAAAPPGCVVYLIAIGRAG